MTDSSNENLPKVSVLCITYNQENFIAKCLDGFISQKTDFPFEVIIHDDCSTDGTLDIVLSYEKKYPDLFIVVTEEENQFSKGVNLDDILLPFVRGRYIAVCEGDDFWCDEMKLQRQYEFMEKHLECSLVCHNTIINDLSGKRSLSLFNAWTNIHKMSDEDIFIGWNVHTSSYFFRREFYEIQSEYTKWLNYFGDYVRLCHAKDCGEVFCLPETMSVYNFNNPKGVTVVNNNNFAKTLAQTSMRIEFVLKFDALTDHRHSTAIKKLFKKLSEDLQRADQMIRKL